MMPIPDETPSIQDLIARTLTSGDQGDARWDCVHALQERGDKTLILLSSHEDTDVRDWATFGLSCQIGIDTLEIREALRARLDDADDETREEAMASLARRGDTIVFDPVLRDVERGGVGLLLFEPTAESFCKLCITIHPSAWRSNAS